MAPRPLHGVVIEAEGGGGWEEDEGLFKADAVNGDAEGRLCGSPREFTASYLAAVGWM